MRSAGARAADAWLGALFWCIRHVPWLPRAIRGLILWGAWRLAPAVRAATTANAAWLLGPGSSRAQRIALGKAVLASFFDTVTELGASRGVGRGELLSRIGAVEGAEGYERARSLGRGAVLLTAHLGPFEAAVASLREREPRVHIVFRRDRFAAFERLRTELHARLGVVEAPIDDGLTTWLRLREALAADEVVLLQGDRAMPGQRSRRVAFMGGHIEIPLGPVRLAQLTGAPLVPTFAAWESGRRVRIMIAEPILVGEGDAAMETAVQRVARSVESVVGRYPEQWLVLEKAWLEDRPQQPAAPCTATAPSPSPVSAS